MKMHNVCVCVCVSVCLCVCVCMSVYLWSSPGKNIGIPFPGDLFNPGIEPWCPTLLADSLMSEPRGKPCE